MGKYFGTDGVRGVANTKVSPELAFKIGTATGRVMLRRGLTPKVILGRDTRRSGPMLGAALSAGFCAVGVDVATLAIVPTGCISFVTRTADFGMGAVISASHNPAEDNGIKLIGENGGKLPDDLESEIEAEIDIDVTERPIADKVGFLGAARSEIDRYLDFIVSLCPERLDGMTVAVDCSHGAAFELAPAVLMRLGAVILKVGVDPDGMNINSGCGATHPTTIQDTTRSSGVSVGIAFDGDADRAVFADNQGRLINGDRMMAIWAQHWAKEMQPKAVVGTIMSNGGFESALTGMGIELLRANVGDKYVSQKMNSIGGKIGGEQSGHIIFSERGPTGDGLITMIEFLRVMRRSEKSAAELYAIYDPWPQLLVNVSMESKEAYQVPGVSDAIQMATDMLGARGRINVRPSGTQPMVRVMVEADEESLRDQATERVVSALIEYAGGSIYSRVDLTHALGD